MTHLLASLRDKSSDGRVVRPIFHRNSLLYTRALSLWSPSWRQVTRSACQITFSWGTCENACFFRLLPR